MEEKIISLFREDWEIPPKAPITIFNGIIHFTKILQEEKIISMGIIFWIVINKNKLRGVNFILISGVHKWRGAIPLFSIKAKGGAKA